MNTPDYRFLYFDVLDYTYSHVTSGYTLPITPFTFIPKFDSGDDKPVSNTRILWDFGDGTTSRDITATHFYKIPGTYSVKCYFYGASGIGYESSFCQNILVKDFISDTLVISGANNPIIRASHYEKPFLVSRFNSWQTYNILLTEGATIALHVSGNSAPVLDLEKYELDKYAHLKPNCHFAVIDFNPVLSGYDVTPIDHFKTLNNKEIYVKLDASRNIVLCDSTERGSVLAGTSGNRLIYYTDDYVKAPVGSIITPTLITASFDFTNFYDNDNIKYSIISEYPVLNNVTSETYGVTIYPQDELGCVVFSTNGIDSEGNFSNNTFNIGKNKFVGQKIPFVARLKDNYNYTSKSWPKFTLKSENDYLTNNSIKFYLKDNSTGFTIPSAIEVYEDYDEFSSYEKLGFFKGYIVPKIPFDNVTVCCDYKLLGETFQPLQSEHIIATNPQSTYIYKIDLSHNIDNLVNESGIVKTLIDTSNLSGMYASIIVPQYAEGTVSYDYWAVDSDQDLVAKIDFDANTVSTTSLISGSSPSFIAADSEGNVWVTLYDAVSVCKLSSNGDILFYAVPDLINEDYSSNTFYMSQSGAAGSNSIMPALLDIDINDNAWVAYNYPLSSFVCKYDKFGNLINRININYPFIAYDILCTVDNFTWVLVKHINNNQFDKLLKINQNTLSQTFFNFDYKLWSFTCDIDKNLWFIANQNDIVKFDTLLEDITLYATITSQNQSLECNFNGIVSTTQRDLLVFDNADQQIKIIKTYDPTGNPTTNLKIIPLNDINTVGFYQNIINSRGDVTGLRYSLKYLSNQRTYERQGCCSNIFNVSPLSGKYNLAKLNENFDMHAQIKNFAFQESLRDSTVLFDDFFKTILGTIDDEPTLLGKKIYEKIANFVDNNAFIDTCNVEKLNTLHNLVNENLYIFNTYNFPSNVTRLLDLFSIKLSKLKGDRNKFNENFNGKGYSNDSDISYGKNLGTELNFFNTVLTAGADNLIVAYERFSQYYTICNTNVLTAQYIDPVAKTYALSSYSPAWAWPLVLPSTYTPEDITKYYTFYQYVSTYAGQQIEGIINWNDKYTTVLESISSYNDWWNIAENMLTRELMLGLELLSSNS